MDIDRNVNWGSTLVKRHDDNKTYVLVKLSESFSNAIQEYSATQQQQQSTHKSHHHNHHQRPSSNNSTNNGKHNNNPIEAPTIKFHGSRGAIRFPNGKSYEFSLEQSDTSVECIRQTEKRWESVGKMACCLHVKGKDDVYQRTRTKMEAAEQEKRKYCTKLLSSDSPGAKQTNNNITNNSNHYINLSKYPDISNSEQLKRYKADFDRDFKEYQTLHGYLQKIEERFRRLRESLKQSAEGSPEWESAKEQIFNEYERVKSDSNFHKARSRYKQLYNKLAHIKQKIFQFKRQHKNKRRKA